MLYWTIKFTIISIIFICLVHHLISFFTSTLTVPKIKDLVNIPKQKYESMYNVISNQTQNQVNERMIDNESYKESLLPKVNVEDNMKKELKSFLKSQMEESQDKIGVSNITDLNYTTTSNSFSFINE